MTRLRYLAKTPYALFGVFSVLIAAISIWSHLQQALIPEITGFVWSCVTGVLLLSVLLYQWYLMRKRWIGQMVRQDIVIHRWVGVSAVFLFAAHAARSGYTWMSAVTIIFFLIAITGILNKEILRFKTRTGYLIWLALHIGFSVSILPLILVHIWVALAY